MHKSLLVCGVAFIAAAAGGQASASANLLGDPGFENTPVPVGGLATYSGGQTFGGAWQVVGNAVTLVETTYTEGFGPPIVFNSHSGSNWLDLTALGNEGPTDGIYQDVATTAGRTYNLSFYVGNANTDGSYSIYYADPVTVNLSIDGGALMPFTNGNIAQNAVNWELFNTSFVATGATTRVAFFNGAPLTDNANGLDDIALTASVPEPAAWTMLVTGFVLAGALIRRRPRLSASAC